MGTRTYRAFCAEVEAALTAAAESKGYNATGVDGENRVYAIIHGATGGHGHAIGEIVYKALRYARKRDPHDLVKLAAWAFLIYTHHDD
jgi:hypothetical protein